MSSVTVESEEKKKSKGRRNSCAVEDTGTYGESGPLKKGPWTSAEDAILVEYVTKHGEGNWNNVQKNSGLSRCGKSCRLRWANHLRPDLKKGPFTPEEEQLIIELHSKMGNKWARMAAELPGRTDNEIKNYWNTRIKRRVRVGLPIYPPDLQQVHDKNEGRQDMMTMQTGPALGPDVMQNHELEFADVEFKSLDFSQEVLSYSSDLLDISACGLLKPGVYSSPYDVLFPSMHPAKRPRELGTMFSDQDGSITSGLQALNRWTEYSSKGVTGPFCLSSPYDSSLSTNSKPPTSMLSGSHALLNGNSSSSSESLCGTVKLELPSLQYTDTQQDGVGTPVSPLPSFESDTFVLSPPLENLQTYSFSPHGSGLLAEVVSQNLKNPNKYISDAPFAPDGSFYMGDPYETDCDLRGDPNSPLATSVFSNSTSISGPFLDEPASDFKPENILVQHYEKESPEQIDYSGRPDYLLGKMCH